MSRTRTQTGRARKPRARAPRASFTLTPRGPFSLEASARFLEGFGPAAQERSDAEGHLHLAFAVEGSERAAGVCVREWKDGRVAGEIVAGHEADTKRIRAQVERILSLDVDGSGFAAVGRRDPVVGDLQKRSEGLRPVLFLSPYEAAAWALISHRIRIAQAATVKRRMSEELGQTFTLHGERQAAFPSPRRLARLEAFKGLSERKVEWLRELAGHAQSGALDAERLRALPTEEALEQLREIPGIGPFSSELILLRGAGEPDHLPNHERRFRRAVALAYGLTREPSPDAVAELAERWRPYRTWTAVLLRSALETAD